MKKQLSFIGILCLALINQLKAQEIPRDISERITNSTYIFEGEVIRSDAYWTQDSTFIYTSSTVEIHKIFKGNMDCGTVELITDGGRVGERSLIISHNLVLKKGMKGLFLCNTTQRELPTTDFYPETDSLKLDIPYDLQGYIKYFEDGINYTVVDRQFNLDSLAELYNVVELYTQLNYVDCGIGPVMKVREHKPKTKIPTPVVQPQGIYNLSYYLINPHITQTVQQQFEFDIALGDDIDTGVFSNAYIVLRFDTTVFGTNITFTPQVTNIGVLADPTSYYPALPFNGPAHNEIIIEVSELGSPTQNLVNISNSPNPALHVILPVADCGNSGLVELIDPMINYAGNQSWQYFIQGGFNSDFYDHVNVSPPLYVAPACSLYIDNIDPLVVNGGTGDVVSVRGYKFGSTRGSGNIFLPNADDGGQTWLALDSTDYLGWTDTLIEFVMPGVIDTNNVYNLNRRGVPGSGVVKLMNDAGDSTQYYQHEIKVFYSIIGQKRNTAGYLTEYPIDLLDYVSPHLGYYTIHPDTSFTRYPDRMSCLRAAIQDWNCLTNAPFVLGDSVQSHSLNSISDDTCIVQFGNLSPSLAGKTFQSIGHIATCQKTFTLSFDIIINKDKIDSFFCDTVKCDSLPHNTIDLYWTLLHELGHGQSLNHIIDPTMTNRIMHYSNDMGHFPFTPAEQRRIYLPWDLSSKEGGNYVMNRSQDPLIISACQQSIVSPQPGSNCDTLAVAFRMHSGCIPLGFEFKELDNSQLNCNSNPVQNVLFVHLHLEKSSTLFYQLYDNLGRQIQIMNAHQYPYGNHTLEINTQNLSSGIYLFKFAIQDKYYHLKFIKE